MRVRHQIPTKPTAIFRGKQMSRNFTEGAYRMRDVLAEIESLVGQEREDDIDNEHMSAETVARCIEQLIDTDREQSRGAIAALAHFAVIALNGSVPTASYWTPLEVIYINDGKPHPMSSYFEVAGDPVSITPDLVALRWLPAEDPCAFERVSIELVRAIGKPISRKRFDAMRHAMAA